ncbi:MAG: hypothetical protein RR667_00370, partial [Muribaculaceae bacterium]
EARSQARIGYEIKSGATYSSDYFKGISVHWLSAACNNNHRVFNSEAFDVKHQRAELSVNITTNAK